MEAGNLGAHEAGGQSIGLNIMLPHEQAPNAWVTPDLSFNFSTISRSARCAFLMRARAICIFPGGFGTLDEMFEALTLIQDPADAAGALHPVRHRILEEGGELGSAGRVGTIAVQDLELISSVETAGEALEIIDGWDYDCE